MRPDPAPAAEGGCLCNSIRYRISATPLRAKPLSLQIVPTCPPAPVRCVDRDQLQRFHHCRRRSGPLPLVTARGQNLLREMWNAADLPAR